jgi:Family of unknown function (DUF6496)
MHEFKEGTLSSRSGAKVTNRKQAVAVALSEAAAQGRETRRRNRSLPDLVPFSEAAAFLISAALPTGEHKKADDHAPSRSRRHFA